MKSSEQLAYEKARRMAKRQVRQQGKFYTFTKVLALVYLVLMAVFTGVLIKMQMLPTGLLIAVIVILVLLSAVLFIQLFFRNIKMWAKVLATFLSAILIVVYGAGSAFGLGTLSFLNSVGESDNANAVQVADEPFNVLISGIDVRGKISTQGRSDVNMLVTVNPKTGKVLLTSIPRDYCVRLVNHDYQTDKLTHTGFYGIDDTITSVEDLLDCTVNYYVKVNFSTVEKFIDAIGGVDVYSEYTFNPVKMKSWTVKKGMNHMNGAQALAFARERKAFALGDNQRIKDQQAVMEALIKKATSSRTVVLGYNKILNSLKDYVKMNMSTSEVQALIRLQVSKNIQWTIEKNTLTGHDSSQTTYTTGGAYCYVMAQDEQSVQEAQEKIQEVLDGDTEISN